MKDVVVAKEMPPLTLKALADPCKSTNSWALASSASTKIIRRNMDGMKITIELARGNREQTIQVLKELIHEIDVGTMAT